MLKKLFSLAPYLIVIAILGSLIRYFALHPISTPQVKAQSLYSTALRNTAGEKANLGSYRGKMIVLNFWATWCPPCREEMPELSALQDAYKDKNVVVLGIAVDETNAIKQFLTEAPVSYPIYIAENESMALATELGNTQSILPYTVIIDTNNIVIDTFLGRINKKMLEEAILKHAS